MTCVKNHDHTKPNTNGRKVPEKTLRDGGSGVVNMRPPNGQARFDEDDESMHTIRQRD